MIDLKELCYMSFVKFSGLWNAPKVTK